MKEVNEININEVSENQTAGLTAQYEKLSDIPSRLKFLVDIKKSIAARKIQKIDVSPVEIDESDRLIKSFGEKYISKGNAETRRMIFEMMGSIKAESDYDCYREYATELKDPSVPKNLVPTDKENREKAAKWIMDQTAVGTNITAVNEVFRSLNSVLQGDEKAEKRSKEWQEKGKDDYYKQYKVSFEKRNAIDDLAAKNDSEYSYESLKDWPQNVGDFYIKERREDEAKSTIRVVRDRYQKGIKHELKEEFIRDKVRAQYNKPLTIEEKIDFLAENLTKDIIRSRVDGDYDNLNALSNNMLNDFIKKNIKNANVETVQKVFELLGKKLAENTNELMAIDSKYREEFKDEGKIGIRKADALAWGTPPAIRANALKYMRTSFIKAFQAGSLAGTSLWKNTGVSINDTVEDYARKAGVPEEDIPQFLENRKTVKGTKVIDALVSENSKQDPGMAAFELEALFQNDVANQWLENGSKSMYKTFDEKKSKLFMDITEKINTEISYKNGVEEWLKSGAGMKRYNNIEASSHAQIERMGEIIDKKTKSYDNYIKLHTGMNVCKADEKLQKDYFVKALAATTLMNSGNDFKVDQIHKYVKLIKDRKEINEFFNDKEALYKAISSPENMNEAAVNIFGGPYKVAPENVEKYVTDMYKLSRSMMSSEKRSNQYKAYSNSVDKIAKLYAKYDFSLESDRVACAKELTGLNMDLVASAQKYMNGKERVRTTGEGKERFNNTLDSLAILSENAPKLKRFIKKTVDNINKERKAKPGSVKYVDLSAYGAKRAEKAKKQRQEVSNYAKKIQTGL